MGHPVSATEEGMEGRPAYTCAYRPCLTLSLETTDSSKHKKLPALSSPETLAPTQRASDEGRGVPLAGQSCRVENVPVVSLPLGSLSPMVNKLYTASKGIFMLTQKQYRL